MRICKAQLFISYGHWTCWSVSLNTSTAAPEVPYVHHFSASTREDVPERKMFNMLPF